MTRAQKIALAATAVALVIGLIVWQKTKVKVKDLPTVTVQPAVVLEQKVYFPAVTPDGQKVVYWSNESAEGSGLFMVNLSTKAVETFRALPAVSTIDWSPDRTQALISAVYEDTFGTNDHPLNRNDAYTGALAWWIFDLNKGTAEPLPLEITSAAWSKSGDQIYYHYFDLTGTEPVSELTARTVSSGQREVLGHIPAMASYRFQEIDEQTLLLTPLITDVADRTSLYLFDLASKSLETLADQVKTGSGSTNGRFILYQSAAKNQTWHLIERAKNRDLDLGLAVESHFALWLSDEEFLVIERRQALSDRLWLVQAEDLSRRELVIQADQPLHIESTLEPVGRAVYFTSGNLLYKLELP